MLELYTFRRKVSAPERSPSPAGYVHSPGEMVDLNDVENGVSLLLELLKKNGKKITRVIVIGTN